MQLQIPVELLNSVSNAINAALVAYAALQLRQLRKGLQEVAQEQAKVSG